MRGSRLLCLLLISGLLSGCGFMDWLETDPDSLKLGAIVREEVERVETERGTTRRDYIDRRIKKKIDEMGENLNQIAVIEEKIGALGTRIDSLARRTVKPPMALSVDTPEAPSSEELEALREETASAVRAVSDLIDMAGQREAEVNARFERLELRTRKVAWPEFAPGTAQGLHLASYKTHSSALRGWEILVRKYPVVLKGHEPILVEVETVAGRFVRLIAGAGLPETSLIRLRDQVRAGGDYAMIMPIQRRDGGSGGSTKKNSTPGS